MTIPLLDRACARFSSRPRRRSSPRPTRGCRGTTCGRARTRSPPASSRSGYRPRRPRRHLGAQSRRMALRAVRYCAHRRHPGQHQSRVSRVRARARAQQSGCQVLVLPAALKSSDYVDMLRTPRSRGVDGVGIAARGCALPHLRARGVLGDAPLPPGTLVVRAWSSLAGPAIASAPLEALTRRSIPTTRSTSSSPAARPASPKGATLTHHNIVNNARYCAKAMALGRRRPALHPGAALPLLRHGARRACAACHRRDHGLPGRGLRAAATLRAVAQERCTALHGVPTMFIAELEHPRLRDASTCRALRTGIMAGAPCPIEMMRRVIAAHAHAARSRSATA